jgi:DNA-binding CsgD family transcriptional regulator
MRASRPSGKRAYMVLVSPMRRQSPKLSNFRPAVSVVIADPDAKDSMPVDRLQRAFGLTAAESKLAVLIGSGESLRSAAGALGVTYGTARARLAQIFEKTQTRRQGELVKTLLATLAVGWGYRERRSWTREVLKVGDMPAFGWRPKCIYWRKWATLLECSPSGIGHRGFTWTGSGALPSFKGKFLSISDECCSLGWLTNCDSRVELGSMKIVGFRLRWPLITSPQRKVFHSSVLDEILQERVVSSRNRCNPRGVKRKMTNFPLRPRLLDVCDGDACSPRQACCIVCASRFCVLWIRNTIKNVTTLELLLITSWQVSE